MRTAIVWNHATPLRDCGFRIEQYVHGMRLLGHEAVLVSLRSSAEGYDPPVHVADDEEHLSTVGFWKDVGAEVAVVVTWHRMSPVLEAIRAADTRVVAVTDTDGQIGLSVYPTLSLQRMMVRQKSWRSKLRVLRYWARRYASDRRTVSDEDLEFVASSRQSDAIVFGTDVAAQRFMRFLAVRGSSELEDRIAVVPFTVGASFFSCAILPSRDDCVVAMGRWNDPQKDLGLLIRTITRFAALRPTTRVVIMGSGGEEKLRSLASEIPNVEWIGPSTQETVARYLSGSRVLLFSSRWEGCPHAAIEALVLGSTLVGPPIPALESWCRDREFGTLSSSRRPSALAGALASECEMWDDGRRDPHRISAHWRSKCAPEVVCADLLAAVGL